jgi:hypothetical protein
MKGHRLISSDSPRHVMDLHAEDRDVPLRLSFGQKIRLRLKSFREFLHKQSALLWWLHSGYALLLGILVMRLGSKNFTFLRWIIFPLSFIWVSSLLLPLLSRLTSLAPAWRERLRLVVNYFNKNFYQQLLFFLLPLYYASATLWSRNMIFVLVLAASAILSTMDVFYDRYISLRLPLTVLFFNFNLFACVNVMLPVLWSVDNSRALWTSAAITLGGFVSFFWQVEGWRRRRSKVLIGLVGLGLSVLILLFRSFIPPAPLQLTEVIFGDQVDALQVVSPFKAIPSGWSGNVAALTAIKAPNGLKERVRHRWYLNGEMILEQDLKVIVGGRGRGFRLWSQVPWDPADAGRKLVLDVVTKGGQLIGRATLPSTP